MTEGAYTYRWPRPAVTVDAVVFARADRLRLLLVQRGVEPFAGRWALPGGFVHMDESLHDAVRRELAEETGVELAWMEQLQTFGAPDRDPRGRVISVAYLALVSPEGLALAAGTDADRAAWFDEDDLPDLAFDHADIVAVARRRLAAKARYQPVGFELLPERFTLAQLQALYEELLGRPLDKRNFRKKVARLGLLQALDEHTSGPGRPARLHRFDRQAYARAEAEGFDFEL
jgi:8-oxo-dGTP diphosphatase